MDQFNEDIGGYWKTEAGIWTVKDLHPIMSDSHIRKNAITSALSDFEDGLRNAKTVLDIGAGGGLQMYLPKLDSSRITSLDVCEAMLRGNSACNKVLADARDHLPFDDRSFEYVSQFFLNRYLMNQIGNMGEIIRVLRSGGRFLLLDHSFLGHPQEVAEFDPYKLENTAKEYCESVHIRKLDPERQDLSGKIYRGPLYLFTGVKK